MNPIFVKRLGFAFLGGIVGGIAGYFVASLVIKQLQKQESYEKEEETFDEVIKVGRPERNTDFKKRDYTKYATEKKALAELAKPYKSKQDNIRVISLEEYESNRNGNRELITYYAGDTTFCDANEDIVPNPGDLFVPNVHLHFGEESEDPDIVYIRNENNGVDYEITQVPGKYAVIIMGMPDEEPKPKPKPKRHRATKKGLESFESEENEGEE